MLPLEALAVKAYAAGCMSLEGVRRVLGLSSRWDGEAMLKQHDVWPSVSFGFHLRSSRLTWRITGKSDDFLYAAVLAGFVAANVSLPRGADRLPPYHSSCGTSMAGFTCSTAALKVPAVPRREF